ncbi:3-galactosyl-N-acetylglucosaminide 4-alpha-L-fucosyltransferase FUT3-like [Bufo gargarizans]|uniref:3-galactosyl-N-acetylglucosaminide 4-alpha-L-fucosyltransferase FUT3-like n=1 Tax=Bufo gargarizans TaxID=30331 RepID=UPI001CF13E59|nr:3-galactosyl-N-acetylglucosaminide 4-alpha-L-fucosyltransferase FUT3-like [Bufo gargarizans]
MTTLKNTIFPLKEEREIIILIWKYPWIYTFPLDKCHDFGIIGCKLSADTSLYSVADVVFIRHVDIMYDKKQLPQGPRPHFQSWIWYNMEPPLIANNLYFLDNLFNMTMTYRLDSHIFNPYGKIEAIKEHQNFTIPSKSKLVSWVVSKWYTGAPRIAYYEELKKHITIDVYGAKHKKLGRSKDELLAIISEYKFYLAFENSIHKDYITEKLWSNAFESWAVPVVLGTSRKNYELFVPGDAFIHVDDFPSPKELAAYLLELDKNDEKYEKYFNWRYKYRVQLNRGHQYRFCQMCTFMRDNQVYQSIPSIKKWFLNDM